MDLHVTRRSKLYKNYKIPEKLEKLIQDVKANDKESDSKRDDLIKRMNDIDDNLNTINLRAGTFY